MKTGEVAVGDKVEPVTCEDRRGGGRRQSIASDM